MKNTTRFVGQFSIYPNAFDDFIAGLPEQFNGQGRVLVFVDRFFEATPVAKHFADEGKYTLYVCDSSHEPTTQQIDWYMDDYAKKSKEVPAAVIGIGGGVTLDTAKAVSNLFGNGGSAADYQGWDLLKKPGIYKIGVPTLSGTGAETSRTCVLLNVEKNLKMGMNSEHTLFDQLILDPQLSSTVPRDQYFYTGMDTYIHCVESLAGSHRHPMADAFSREALEMCRRIFLGQDDMMTDANRQELMVASYLGGCAIANSFVGVVHPFSAGLSVVLGMHHCVANCVVMNQMKEFYPAEVDEFLKMMNAQNVEIPRGVCANLSDEDFERLYLSTVVHEKPLINALGPDFKSILTKDKVISLFQQM